MSKVARKPNDGMITDRAPTPVSTSASRASTVVLNSSDRGSPSPSQAQTATSPTMSTQPASEAGRELGKIPIDVPLGEAGKFMPYQSLMKTELTLEYGKKLKNTRIVHQELLSCHSSTAARVFRDALPLRLAYAAADKLRKDLKEIVSPRVTKDEFEADHLENRAIPLIGQIYEDYPLKSYRQTIRKAIDAIIVEEVGKRHVVMTASKTAFAKKDLKDLGIKQRLMALLSKGVMEVAQRLSSILRQIKYKEREAAKITPQKAAAQRRWIIPDVEDQVVLSLVTWMYFDGTLHWDDAKHLYALHALANTLGVSVLAQKCLGRLAAETNEMLEEGSRQGMSLQELLEFEPGTEDDQSTPASRNFVQVVFGNVLKELNPPKQLVDLVTQSLAERLDPALWEKLASGMSHATLRQIMTIILARRQSKLEDVKCLPLKLESQSTGDELMPYPPNEQTANVG